MTAQHSSIGLPSHHAFTFLHGACSIIFFALVASAGNLSAQVQVFSRSDSNTDLWDNNSNLPWAYPSSINRARPDLEWGGQTRHYVLIGHNNNTTMNVNGNTWYTLRTLTLQSSASSNRTFNRDGSAGISLSEGFYNDVNATQTFNVPIGVDGGTVAFAGSTTTGSTTFTGDFFLNSNTAAFNSSGNFTLSGKVQGENGKITKTGSGTLTLSGSDANTYTGQTTVDNGTLKLDKTSGNAIVGNVRVNGGILLLARSNQVDSGAGYTVTLSGGTIQRASGVSEAFGALNIDGNSFLNFGDGTAGNLTFGAYDGGGIPSHKLTVNNFFAGNTLVFGSDLSAYISSSYSGTAFTSTYFDINSTSGGFTSNWDSGTSTFTITAIPEPSTYVAAAGLLAMFFWPVRRRIIKDIKSIFGLRPTGRERIEAYRRA